MKELERALEELNEKEEKIARMLQWEREVVMATSKAINLFLGRSLEGKAYVEKAEEVFAKLSSFPYRREHLLGVEGEIVEAKVVGRELLSISFPLNHSSEAIVYGVLDAIGELKRALLKYLIEGNVGEAKMVLNRMETLYNAVEGYSFSNAVLPSFKRKKDNARYALEIAMEALSRHI